MKMTTLVWVKAKNIGRPETDLIQNLPLLEAIKQVIKWLAQADMGKRLEITFARKEQDLETPRDKTESTVQDLAAFAESIMALEIADADADADADEEME